MNWLTNFVRPKIRALVPSQKDIPDHLWVRCPNCESMLFHRDLEKNLHVCTHCQHHMRWDVMERLEHMLDTGSLELHEVCDVPVDPLKFKDRKKYTDRLRDAQSKRSRKDAIVVASGTINGAKAVIAAFDFKFMGGSMGTGVGEGIVRAAEIAANTNAGLITIPASGGARMQEGILSLMQMPRTIIATSRLRDKRLPHIVLLTDPTTGGVSASFAMMGDIHLAEPKAQIGFAGKRVIQETIRESLPDGFQTAEYLEAHGMVDRVVSRADLPETLGRLLGLVLPNQSSGKSRKAA